MDCRLSLREGVLEGIHSAQCKVTSGVPQGTVLGPLLFLVYINDMPPCVSSRARLFADDCLLYRPIKTEADATKLQEDIDALQNWESTWQMSFNPDKCEVLRITNKRNKIMANYYIHGQQLQIVDNAKYLGLTISKNLSWNNHVNNITKKANSTLAFLRRNIRNCPQRAKTQAYNTFVRPSLEYASTVWDPHTQANINKVESIQRRAARFVTNNYDPRASVTTLLQDLNWPTLQHRRQLAKLIMMYRITYHLIEIPSITYLIPSRSGTRGHNIRYLQPSTRVLAYQYSFFPSTIRLWNNLPQTLVSSGSIDIFRHSLTNTSLP